MTTTDTTVSNLIINTMTQAQYNQITPSDTELYLVTDSTITSSDVTTALGYTPTSPANVDGQWVWSYSVVWSSAAAGDFTVNLGTTGISPKNYLPQDNYSYLVQFTASLTNSATTASALVLKNSSYGSDVVQLCCANKDSAYSDNTFFIIVDSSRTIDFKLGYAAARFSITAMGYRRIGTNT